MTQVVTIGNSRHHLFVCAAQEPNVRFDEADSQKS